VILRAIPVAAVLAVAGCNPSDPTIDPAPPLLRAEEIALSPPQATGGGPPAAISREQAIARVANARCDKLRDCPSVLIDRYKDDDVCVGRERARVENMWGDGECPRVDSFAVESCARAARAEKCDARGELFTPIIGACASSRICPPQ